MTITHAKLQHIYDLHASDFGLLGNKNPQQIEKLSNAKKLHLSDAGTQRVEGQYRGSAAQLHYNAMTQNVVVTDLDEYVVAAFKASPAQAGYILSRRRLS